MKRASSWIAGVLFLGSASNALAATPLIARVPGSESGVAVRPEYERRLARVLLSVPAPSSNDAIRTLNAVYGELEFVLPSETRIDIALTTDAAHQTRSAIRAFGSGRSVGLFTVPGEGRDLDIWAQDIGEPIWLGSEPKFLVSRLDPENPYNRYLAHQRRDTAVTLFGPDAVIEADFVFEAGNLSFDRTDQGLRVFIGFNDVQATIEADRARGRKLGSREVLERVSRLFGGAEVALLGRSPQSPSLFHLDHVFVILSDRIAVVASITDDAAREEKSELALYAAQLESLGYRILEIPHTSEEIRNHRNSTNAVPFVDAEGRLRILFPVFPGEVVDPGTWGRALTKVDLRGKALVAHEVYERAGYLPTPVRDFTFSARGSLHCITNVLD